MCVESLALAPRNRSTADPTKLFNTMQAMLKVTKPSSNRQIPKAASPIK
jgi:hypothetical protein